MDLMLLDDPPKANQSLRDPFQFGRLPPVLFRWKIDDPAGSGEGAAFGHEHFADVDFVALAGILVGAKVRGEYLLKH
jgi:hypothetical protein